MNLPDSAILQNLYVPGLCVPDPAFEKSYIACRASEQRVYTDGEVALLPKCAAFHPHYEEWVNRALSSKKLLYYLQQKKKALRILEVGCGNGWFCHQLSHLSRSQVTGVDINFTELQQAARVFNGCRKLKFVYGDIRSGILNDKQYDIILFAATIQYFPAVDAILELCLQHLRPGGEIHIIDSHFYAASQCDAAGKRTTEYYGMIGHPEMSRYYHHHLLTALASFNHSLLYNPASFINRLTRSRRPFPWIKICKD